MPKNYLAAKWCKKSVNNRGFIGIYRWGDVRILGMESIDHISLPALAATTFSPDRSEIECEVMRFFEEFRSPLLRYSLSFGISVHDAEEVIQEVFLALFLHCLLYTSPSPRDS